VPCECKSVTLLPYKPSIQNSPYGKHELWNQNQETLILWAFFIQLYQFHLLQAYTSSPSELFSLTG
jgi:hypothetical protein